MKGGIGLIKALYNLGKVYENKNPNETVLLSLLENPNENKKYPNVIKLKLYATFYLRIIDKSTHK